MSAIRKDGTRHVYVLIKEELHVETPIGTIVIGVDTTQRAVRIEINGDMIPDTFQVPSKDFAGIAIEHKGGAWLRDWVK